MLILLSIVHCFQAYHIAVEWFSSWLYTTFKKGDACLPLLLAVATTDLKQLCEIQYYIIYFKWFPKCRVVIAVTLSPFLKYFSDLW